MRAEEVRAHLRRRLPQLQTTGEPEPLPGGSLNLVWRVPAKPAAVVVKHAPPHVASAPEIPLDPQRVLLEARCLHALGSGGELGAVSDASARPPRLLDIDAHRCVLVMEEIAPAVELGAWLRGGERVRPVARRLGRFIGRLHAKSHASPELAPRFDNLAVQRTRHRVQYLGAAEFAAKAGAGDAARIGARCVALGERFQEPGICLIMGDLWPPSVLVAGTEVRIIDWELAHFGNPAQDLGHLAAHLWMHADRAGSEAARQPVREFSNVFLEAYLEAVGPSRPALAGEQAAEDAAVHFGAELLMRTAGPFAAGYLYDGLPPDEAAVRSAARTAAQHILCPRQTDLFEKLCGSRISDDTD